MKNNNRKHKNIIAFEKVIECSDNFQNIKILSGKLAAEEDSVKRIREDLAKKLVEGERIKNINTSSPITNLKKDRNPKVIFPTNIYDSKYIGALKGYYVAETNAYNVLDNYASFDDKKFYDVGYILPFNPFSYISDGFNQVKYLNPKESSGIDFIRNNYNKGDSKKENIKNDISTFEKYLYDATEEKNFTFDTMPLLFIQKDLPVFREEFVRNSLAWLNDIFSQCYFYSSFNSKIAKAENPLVGYWENDELHFIQIITRKECEQEKYSLKLDVFSRNTGILESDVMLEKGAVFIGCGSVGSLFALELAKAGVGRFLLVDNDIFGYHNICRHQCGIYDVGRFKTDALKDRILQINPYAKVITQNCQIQEVPISEISSFCDKNTIVIGGADNREGDLYANNFAKEIGMPFMSVGCWERAFAGEIFYCFPENMPNYSDFIQVAGLTSARVNNNRRFYTTETDLEKISFEPGISVDINFVTIIAVKIALDILNIGNKNYTQRVLPHLTQYTLVCNTNNPKIGGNMAEIFTYPLQVTTSIVIPYSKKKDGN